MVTWQASALDCEPSAHTCRSWTLITPSTSSIPARISASETPRGVPSSRMFSVSRTMPTLDHRISAAIMQRERRVDPVLPGEQNARATRDHGGCRERVARHVDKRAAHVHIARHTPQQSRNYAVHHHPGRRHNHHQPRLHGHGRAEPVNGFHANPQRNHDQRGRIHEGSQHARPLVAESARVVCGPRLKVDRRKAQQKRQKIRCIVARLREQRQRMGAQSRHKRDHHIGQRGHQREAQYGLCSSSTRIPRAQRGHA